MISRLLFIPTLLISILFLPLSSYLPSSLRGQPGHIVRLVALTPFAPGSPSPPRYRSFFPLFSPSTLPSPSASPLLRPCCLSRCLPKVAWPNVAAPFVDITQGGCLPPCQTLLAGRRLCSSAVTARCYYEPPTILVPPMLVDAVDHFARYCLLALSSLLQVWFSPSQARYSSLWCLFVVLLFHLSAEVGYVGSACGILSGPSSNALLLLSDTSPGFYHLLPLIPSLPPPHFFCVTPD